MTGCNELVFFDEMLIYLILKIFKLNEFFNYLRFLISAALTGMCKELTREVVSSSLGPLASHDLFHFICNLWLRTFCSFLMLSFMNAITNTINMTSKHSLKKRLILFQKIINLFKKIFFIYLLIMVSMLKFSNIKSLIT